MSTPEMFLVWILYFFSLSIFLCRFLLITINRGLLVAIFMPLASMLKNTHLLYLSFRFLIIFHMTLSILRIKFFHGRKYGLRSKMTGKKCEISIPELLSCTMQLLHLFASWLSDQLVLTSFVYYWWCYCVAVTWLLYLTLFAYACAICDSGGLIRILLKVLLVTGINWIY